MARVLDRLQAANMSDRGIQTWAQRVCEQIEAALTDIQDQVTAIAAAQAAADAAQTTATTANTTAEAVKKTDKISGSSIVPALVLSAADVGANCTITVAAHTRVYGDGTQVSIAADTITGRAFSTKYAVYYTDTTLADTSPNMLSTTTLSNALNNFATGRHFVGIITTPADGAASTSGGTGPSGTDPDDWIDYSNL